MIFFVSLLSLVQSYLISAHEEKSFLSYMRDNSLIFTGQEYHFRLGIYLSALRYIKHFNKAEHSFELGINHLSHLTEAEYKSLLGLKPVQQKNLEKYVPSRNSLPDSVDWRNQSIVNTIRDQGQCGSCWAFSAIQVTESYIALKTDNLLKLSEGNLVDCCYVCDGCSGGYPDIALQWVRTHQAGKINLEIDYFYEPEDGICKFEKSKAVGFVGKTVFALNEEDLKEKIATIGVASVSIDASHYSFQAYFRGIYDEPSCSSKSLDHAIGCVGYGTENGVDYWIVRNSWGLVWGEHGYIRMSRNKKNQCGIASSAFVLID